MKLNPPTNRAPIRLWLGPAGSGKMDAAIRQLCTDISSTLLVVTSAAQADWMARKAAAEMGVPAAEVRSHIMPFTVLVAGILRHDREYGRTPIGRTFQRIILAGLIPGAIRPDDFLGKMLSAPGFVSALQERLHEWKLAGAGPGSFGAAALAAVDQFPELARKLGDIERLFGAYEQFLHDNRLHDEEDGLGRAAQLVSSGQAGIPGGAKRIVVHGFYRFTAAQRNLLRVLAERGLETGSPDVDIVVTLPYEDRRPLLFAAPMRTLGHLRAEFEADEVLLTSGGSDRTRYSGALGQLSTFLFGDPADRQTVDPSAGPKDQPIQILEAPNSYVEAEMVAREFRRLHDGLHLPWSEFAVILRSTGDYAPILSAVFERYEVPIGAEGSETCAQNPLLKTVLSLLDVVRNGWRRDDVLAFLKSSYTAPDSLDVDLLRKHAWSQGIRDRRDQWLALPSTESSDPRAARAGISPSIRATLQQMAIIDDRLNGQFADTSHFAGVIHDILTTFRLEERITSGEPARVEWDRAALKEGLGVLDALCRIAVLRSTGSISFAEFRDQLANAWENASAFPDSAGDKVCVLEPHACRERPIRVAAVMGLTERVFPRRITEDAFMRDEERLLLRDWTGVDLEEQKLRADDERFLFYLAATAPTERLLLSFPRAAHENDTLPSFFIDEVRAVFEMRSNPERADSNRSMLTAPDYREEPASGIKVVIRTLADVAPRADEAATSSDDLLAACADLFDPQGDNEIRRARSLDAADRLRQVLHEAECRPLTRSVLKSRNLPRLPILNDADLRGRFIDGKNVFTIPELETYAKCPFHYLMRHVWKLKQEIDGVDSAKQSALLHTVLRRFFRNRQRRGALAVSGEAEKVFSELQGILAESLEEARLNTSVHQMRILRRRMHDDLMGFAIREVRFSERFGTAPAHFHLSFGRAPVAVTPDPLSCREPLIVTGPDGECAVRIGGTIDRVDLDETGTRALVVEYEAGRPPEFAAIQRGESLQMPIQILALEQLFGMAAAGACYDSMQEAGRRRFHRAEHVNLRRFGPMMPFDDPANVKPLSREQFDALVQTTKTVVIKLAQAIGNGVIDATPGTHCRGCDFRDVCRTSQVEGHDGERLNPSAS